MYSGISRGEGKYHFSAATRDATVFRIKLKSCRVGIDKNIAEGSEKELGVPRVTRVAAHNSFARS